MLYVLNPNGSKIRLFKNLVWNSEICKIVYMTARDIKKSFAGTRLEWKNVEMKRNHKVVIRDMEKEVKYESKIRVYDYPQALVIPNGCVLHIKIGNRVFKNCTVKQGEILKAYMPVLCKDGILCIYDKKDGFVPILLN